MSEGEVKPLPEWLRGRDRPKGLLPDGFFERGHAVRVDGELQYIGPGSGIANLRACRYEVEVLPEHRTRTRQIEDRMGRWQDK